MKFSVVKISFEEGNGGCVEIPSQAQGRRHLRRRVRSWQQQAPPAVVAAPEERDWTSLHRDITKLIADRLLDEDVAEYIVFSAVCKHWRVSTPSPRDPMLADRRFHPRGWIALCDGTGVRAVDDEAITFFHSASGRVRRVQLQELRDQRILPNLAGFFHLVLSKQASFKMDSFIWLNAAVCIASPSSIAVVVWFPNMPVVICAEPSSIKWTILHTNIQFTNVLPFNGQLYGVTRVGRQLVQVYPLHEHVDPVVAQVPKDLGHPKTCRYYLVESMGAMLVAVLHRRQGKRSGAFTIFKADLSSHTLITGVPSLVDHALFLGDDRCLSVSAKDLQSISSNSVYFASPRAPKISVHSLNDGLFECLSTCLDSSRTPVMSWAYVQPFTLADHLLTYCHHREWTRGVMFHLFYMPSFSAELQKRFHAQDSQVVVPRLREPVDQLKRLEMPNLFPYMSALARITGNKSRLTA
ncbi:hypothetical protein QOZ80_6AG0541120 [Eleusine coracana subsp. coracana]|nr:hypothetical protein QOZ80_6AG0541120 [Eleusine coracana subsp. coracana]